MNFIKDYLDDLLDPAYSRWNRERRRHNKITMETINFFRDTDTKHMSNKEVFENITKMWEMVHVSIDKHGGNCLGEILGLYNLKYKDDDLRIQKIIKMLKKTRPLDLSKAIYYRGGRAFDF